MGRDFFFLELGQHVGTRKSDVGFLEAVPLEQTQMVLAQSLIVLRPNHFLETGLGEKERVQNGRSENHCPAPLQGLPVPHPRHRSGHQDHLARFHPQAVQPGAVPRLVEPREHHATRQHFPAFPVNEPQGLHVFL